ncbi:FimV/HubP family polar landmark protein [Aquimonas voraii]|uniref:Pilus assembly protein FimV n=1 Tax=Aquimonas voraii TaxID=265719 RepID=A0A1G6SM22_9GAMM|nr:FimV/HubP family polar landmark protein [Aquimonas voraii]SDD17972.1 pilus assembly protein FimV [Aquimonas voraii]
MNKMLRLPVALAFALGASNAFALGLGQVQVKSSLNQPLLAEIPVLENAPGEAADLQVRLASSEAFARIGLERPSASLLTSLSFEIVQGEGGKTVIRISTPNRVSDPFVSLLIEAEWARGKLLREYTLLLDPPLAVPSRANPSQTQALPQGDVRPAPSESLATPPPLAAAGTAAAAAPTYAPGESYGPVNSGDSLWKIASQSIPDGSVNINQMMVAIQRANPEAFVGGNMNRLRTGAVLRIPSREEIAAVGAREASQLVREQTSGDTALQPIETDRTPVAAASTQTPRADSRLAIVPPRGEQPASAAQTGAVAGGDGSELRADLARAREQSEALSQENRELKSRVEQLEKMRGDSERLLELRSSELRALQQRLAEIEAQQAAAGATEAAATPAVEAPAAEPAATEPAASELAAPAIDEVPPTAPASEASASAADSAEAAAPATETETAPIEEPAAPAAPPVTEPAASETPAPAETLPPRPPRQEWYENPLVLGGGGALVIGLLALLGLRGRGKKKAAAAAAAAPSRFEGADFGMPGASASAATGFEEHEDEEERELLDRVAEQPDDLERHIDLVRHYFGINDAARFEGAVEAMYAQVYDPDDANWQLALQMGREMLPDHPLFMELPSQDAPVSGWEPAPAASPEPSAYDTSGYRADNGFASTVQATADEPEFRIDLSEPELVVPEIERPNLTQPEAPLEFEFDSTPAKTAPAPAPVPPPVASPIQDDAGLSADAIEAAATKLELARAYLDMGDVEGARGMLEEVTQEGTAEQRQDARRLLDEIR